MSSCRGRPGLIHSDPSLFFPTVLLPTSTPGGRLCHCLENAREKQRPSPGPRGPRAGATSDRLPQPLVTGGSENGSPQARLGHSRQGGLSKRRVPG